MFVAMWMRRAVRIVHPEELEVRKLRGSAQTKPIARFDGGVIFTQTCEHRITKTRAVFRAQLPNLPKSVRRIASFTRYKQSQSGLLATVVER